MKDDQSGSSFRPGLGQHVENSLGGRKRVGQALMVYAVFILGIGWGVHYLAPEFGRVTLMAAVGAGLLSVVWGWPWLRGRGRKVWPVLTLIAAGYVLLGQTVMAWTGAAGVGVAVVETLGLAGTLGALMRVAYYGAFGTPGASQERVTEPVAGQAEGRPRQAEAMRR